MLACTHRIAEKTIPINYLTNNHDRMTADLELQRKDLAHQQRAYYREYSSSLLAGAVACDAAAAVMCWPLSPCLLANMINNISIHNGRVQDAVTRDLLMASSDNVLVDVDKHNRFVVGSVQIPNPRTEAFNMTSTDSPSETQPTHYYYDMRAQ